jgi:hypothetical protein
MTSSASTEEPDSRTSSVSRKRGFNQFAAADDSVVNIEDDSSDEDNQPREKRTRYSEGGAVDDHLLNSTTESSPDIVIISDSPESAYSQQEDDSTDSSDDGHIDAGSAIDPPLAWNTGIPVTIRTSFAERKPQSQLMATQVGVNPQTPASLEVDTAAISSTAPKTASTEPSLDGREIGTVTAKNNSSEEIVDMRSNSEKKREFKRLSKVEKKLEKKLERERRILEEDASREAKRSKRRSKILDQLPSSFGTRPKQKEAEEIIKRLPEDNKNLMPRYVAGTALNFSEMGQTFKLPQKLHKDLPFVQLAKLSFRNPTHSFIMAFLEENQSLIEVMDYKLLVRAFQEYLRLFYGHLPDRLLSLVCSNKHVVGPKAESACVKLLDEARKEVLRKAELEKVRAPQAEARKAETEARRAEKEAWKEESRKAKAQLRGARRAAKESRKAEEEATEAENRTSPAESKNYEASWQSESGNPWPDSLKDLPTNLDMQSCEAVEKSQDPEPYPLDRLLDTRHAHTMESATADSTHKTFAKSPDERQFMRSQEPDVEAMSGIVHTSDQGVGEQKPIYRHPSELELTHRYHWSTEGSPIVYYCLTCALTDHGTSDCHSLTCASCGLHGIHFTDGCPKRHRCTRCHERGHQRSDCPEKLAATADESLCCDICKSSKHLESACHFIWRSFKPGMLKTTKFVADIPIHCYSCGAAGHFGSECGIRHSPLHTEGYSWSISNWRRYVDPQSQNHALSAGKDYSLPLSTKGKKSFNIRGSAQNGAVTPKDDDENIPFIREKVTKPTRPNPRGNQQIKFELSRQEDNDSIPHHQFGHPLSDSRNHPSRAVRPAPPQQNYAEDRHEFPYRPRDDSARLMRERSFSPPPRFHDDGYQPRPGDNYYRMDDSFDSYRPYDRRIGGSKFPARAPEVHNQGPVRGDPAQGGLGGSKAPRGKRQRNRKG